jgi:hypothetical protein
MEMIGMDPAKTGFVLVPWQGSWHEVRSSPSVSGAAPVDDIV